MSRMNVLSPSEQEQFDTPLVFNGAERKHFFDFPLGIRELAEDLRSAVGTVGFLVGHGYFKSSKRFFLTQHYHQREMAYVARQLGLSDRLSLASIYTRELDGITNRSSLNIVDTDSLTKRLWDFSLERFGPWCGRISSPN